MPGDATTKDRDGRAVTRAERRELRSCLRGIWDLVSLFVHLYMYMFRAPERGCAERILFLCDVACNAK